MSKDYHSYELVERGGQYTAYDRETEQRALNPETPLAEQKHIPHVSTTTALDVDPDDLEKPDVPLERNHWRLVTSNLVHILPTAATIAVVQLTIRQVYWFDNDADSTTIPWKGAKISVTELNNLLQFVAKIHEILLVGSLAAMVMHRVRVRLIGKSGLPFGILVGGYQVGSPEYLLSAAFRSGFNRKFWPLSLLIFVFTVLANTLGPVSAVALVPNLDWYDMKNPFGSETLPILFNLTKNDIWPLEITKFHTFHESEEFCFSPGVSTTMACPASGFTDLMFWTASNANEAIDANVTMNDGLSPVQRRLKSRLTDKHDNIPGVAITTSLSHGTISAVGAFWEQVRSREFPVNDVIRPQLSLPKEQSSFQPLVQVQCLPLTRDNIQEIAAEKDRTHTVGDNYDLNTFSVNNASHLPIPDWLYEYQYSPDNKVFVDPSGRMNAPGQNSVNITWLDLTKIENTNLSMAAMIITPVLIDEDGGATVQEALYHFCSVDARWAASVPAYDPSEHLVLSHNITDPLSFKRPSHANEGNYRSDMSKWGISPALRLSQDWVEALNIPQEVGNITGPSLQWLLSSYVDATINDTTTEQGTNETGSQVNYMFSPGNNALKDKTVTLADINADSYAVSASETVATVLSLQITDALARIQLDAMQGGTVILKTIDDTHLSVVDLADGIAGLGAVDGFNLTKKDTENFPTKYTLNVQRYGYGYGFTTSTIIFSIAVLLSHTLLTIIYVIYSYYDYFFVSRWTSSAWGDIGEFAALLINSKPTVELQNTCAGIDSKHTWRKRLRIRETGDGHIGIVVGEEAYMNSQPVKTGVQYGALKEGTLRKRRGSV